MQSTKQKTHRKQKVPIKIEMAFMSLEIKYSVFEMHKLTFLQYFPFRKFQISSTDVCVRVKLETALMKENVFSLIFLKHFFSSLA